MSEFQSTLAAIVGNLQTRFGGAVRLKDSRSREIYLEADWRNIQQVALHLCGLPNVRMAMVFASDRRLQEGVFYIHYTFACVRAGGFLLIRIPIPADPPDFPPLTPSIPTLNRL